MFVILSQNKLFCGEKLGKIKHQTRILTLLLQILILFSSPLDMCLEMILGAYFSEAGK